MQSFTNHWNTLLPSPRRWCNCWVTILKSAKVSSSELCWGAAGASHKSLFLTIVRVFGCLVVGVACMRAAKEARAKQARPHGGAVASGLGDGMITIKGLTFDPATQILVDLQVFRRASISRPVSPTSASHARRVCSFSWAAVECNALGFFIRCTIHTLLAHG